MDSYQTLVRVCKVSIFDYLSNTNNWINQNAPIHEVWQEDSDYFWSIYQYEDRRMPDHDDYCYNDIQYVDAFPSSLNSLA